MKIPPVGTRILVGIESQTPATVTEHTERGFRYEYDFPKVIIPRWGWTETGGEVFVDDDYDWGNYITVLKEGDPLPAPITFQQETHVYTTTHASKN